MAAFEVREKLRNVNEVVAEKVYSQGLDGKGFLRLSPAALSKLVGMEMDKKSVSDLKRALNDKSAKAKKKAAKKLPAKVTSKNGTAYDLRAILKNLNESVGEKLYSNGTTLEEFLALGEADAQKLKLNLNSKELDNLKEAVKNMDSSDVPVYLPSRVCDGQLPGYEHKEGDLGVGYYLVKKEEASVKSITEMLVKKQNRQIQDLNVLKTSEIPTWGGLKGRQLKVIEAAKQLLEKYGGLPEDKVSKEEINKLKVLQEKVINLGEKYLSKTQKQKQESPKSGKKQKQKQQQKKGKKEQKKKQQKQPKQQQKKKDKNKNDKQKNPSKDSHKNIEDMIKKIEGNSAIKDFEKNEKRLTKLESNLEMIKEDPAVLAEEDALYEKLFGKLNSQSSKIKKLEDEVGIKSEYDIVERQDNQWNDILSLLDRVNKLSTGMAPVKAPKRIQPATSSSQDDDAQGVISRQDKQWAEIDALRRKINKLSSNLPPIPLPDRIAAPATASSDNNEMLQFSKKQDKQWSDINAIRVVINKLSKSAGLPEIKEPKRIPFKLGGAVSNTDLKALNNKYDKIFDGIEALDKKLAGMGDKGFLGKLEERYDSILSGISGLTKQIENLEKKDNVKSATPKQKEPEQPKKKQAKNNSQQKKKKNALTMIQNEDL